MVRDWSDTDKLLQADSKEKHVKDLAVVLGTETATIILDDTISVWPEHQHNLMQVLTMSLLLSPHSRACFAMTYSREETLPTAFPVEGE